MADVVTTLIFDDSKALPGIKRVTDAFSDAANAADDLNKTVTDTQQGLGKKVVDTNKQIQESTIKTAEIEKKALKEKIAAQEVYGVSLNKISETLREYRTNLIGLLGTFKTSIALTDSQRESAKNLGVIFTQLGKSTISAFLNPIQTIRSLGDSILELGLKTISSVKNIGSSIVSSLSNPKQIITNLTQSIVGAGKSAIDFVKSGKAVEIGFLGIAKGANILKVAIASTGIGALVLALGGLISFFTRTSKGADFLSQKLAGFKAVAAAVGDIFAKVGEKIFYAFENPKAAVNGLYETVKTNIINRFKSIPLLFGAIADGISSALDLDKKGVNEALKKTGQAFVQFTTGLDTDQQNKFADAVGKIKDNLEEAYDAGTELEKRKQALGDATIRLTKAEAESQKVIEQNKQIAEDTTKSYFERIAAANRAFAEEKSILGQKLDIAKKNLDIVKDEQKQLNGLKQDKQAIADAEAEVANLSAESIKNQIKLQGTINGLIKEYRDALTASSDKLFEIAAAYGVVTEKDQLKFVADKQVEELEKLRTIFNQTIESIKKADTVEEKNILSKLLGTDDFAGEQAKLQKQVEIIDKSIVAVQRSLEKIEPPKLLALPKINQSEISKLEKQLKDVQEVALNTGINNEDVQKNIADKITALTKKGLQSLGKVTIPPITIPITPVEIPKPNVKDLVDDFLADVDNFDELVNKSLSQLLGVPAEDVELVIGGLQTFVSQFGSLLAESQQLALENVDKQIERLSERREKLEDELTREQELYDKGLANNLDAKKAEVDGLIAEEDRLLKEREKLEKEAQKRQLIADTVSQAQALITASIQIAKGFSPLGPFAIPLSIAAIGSLFALFAKVKVDAFKATKLYTGADRIDDYFGVPDQYGKTDKGTGKGYRLWDEQLQKPTNVIISAREMLIPEDVAQRQKVFFDNLKAGMYEGMDLARFIHDSKYKGGSTSIVNNNMVTNVAVKKKVRQFVPFTGRDGKQRAILKTITEDMADGTVIEFDY